MTFTLDLNNTAAWIEKARRVVQEQPDATFWAAVYAQHVSKLYQQNEFLDARNLYLEQQVSELIRKLEDLHEARFPPTDHASEPLASPDT